MPWNQVFPQGSDLVSQAPPLFQQNWAFLNTNISTDHYFNVGAPNEGHHRFSQYVNQAGNPALAADGVAFVKPTTVTGSMNLFYRNAVQIAQVRVGQTGQTVIAVGGVSTTLFNIAGLPKFMGTVLAFDNANPQNTCAFNLFWDGAATSVITASDFTGLITAAAAVGNLIKITCTNPMTVNWSYSVIEV